MNFPSLILPAILLLLAFRVWKRGGRERTIRIGRLWILPLVFTVIIAASIYAQPMPIDLNMTLIDAFVLAFAVGFGCGWFRGQTTHIAVDPESGDLKAKMTPVGLVLIAALILIRTSAFDWLNSRAAAWQIAPTAIVDGFMLFALGLILGWRIEMYLRCRRLRDAAAVADGS